ncbi:MAG: DNA primase [Phycisphaerae bacterium]|nr:DNA primase [Phycisphaerae bacterium]NIX30289.1 DNA primase [Phycisphaerae bacterium]
MSVVEEIKSRLDIVDIISSYVPTLKKAGRTYKGLCPFHNEKTPSFVVFPDTQTWHCFGACGIGGDIFSFVMQREGGDFRDALEILAAKAGVPLQEKTPEAIEADKTRQKLLDIIAAAATYFHELLLKSPQASFVRDYLARRGLESDIIHQFQLGYALDQWEGLKSYLLQKGYAETDMLAAGLLVERDNKLPGYDRFRDRLIIPIRDIRGRVIGFGARALHEQQVPKYLNSPQNALFDKSAVLYGLDVARAAIRNEGYVVIVEGYLDVLQAHQQGYANVVAQMGTALTEEQLKLLKRYTDKLILALDADTAGSVATLRGINTAREVLDEVVAVPTAQGLIRYENRLSVDIQVVTLPSGKDPDDILKEDVSVWQKLIDGASSLVDYYIQQVTAELDLSTAKGKSTAVREIIPILREIGDAIEQEHYLRQLARLVRIDERTLRTELQRTSQSPSRTTTDTIATQQSEPAQASQKAPLSQTAQLEEHCLAMLVGHPRGLRNLNQILQKNEVGRLSADDFLETENRTLFQVVEQWALTELANLDTLLPLVDEHLDGHLASIMALWHRQPTPAADEYVEKQLAGIVLRLRLERLKKQAKELREMQKNAYEAQDREATSEYIKLMQQVNLRLSKLNKVKDALSILSRRRLEERFYS